jgi:protein O-mannosyl-transferase
VRVVPSSSRAFTLLATASTISAAFILYQPILRIGLLSDDYALLMWAERLELMPRDWGQIRPLPILAWWLLSQVTSAAGTPAALHAFNVVLHGFNAMLVWVIAGRLTTSRRAALGAAAIFLTIPVAVEPVAWGSGVFDVMLATFGLALAVVATAQPELRPAQQAVGLLLTIAMMASKETGVIAGPLFLLVHWARWGRFDRSAIVLGAAQAVLAGTYALVRELTGRLDHRLTPTIDLDGIGRLVSGIGRALLVPLHRDVIVAYPLLAIVCAVLMVSVLAVWIVRRRQSPDVVRIAVLAVLGTLLCVAPTIRLFGITSDLQGTRYVYLASAWWSIALASALLDGWRTTSARLAAGTIAVVVVLGAAIATRAHLEPWTTARGERDRILLQLISLPTSCRQVAATAATDNVAGAYVFRNGLNEALATLGRSFEWVDETRASEECRVNLVR